MTSLLVIMGCHVTCFFPTLPLQFWSMDSCKSSSSFLKVHCSKFRWRNLFSTSYYFLIHAILDQKHWVDCVFNTAISYELYFPRDYSQVDSSSCEIKKIWSNEAAQMSKHISEMQLNLIISRVQNHTMASSVKKLLRLIVSSIPSR